MATQIEIAWLAGLLEGEGCFATRQNHNPIIQLIMTDKDVVVRAAQIMECHKVIKVRMLTKAGKNIYRAVLYGSNAIAVMKLVYAYMGTRRKEKIIECVKHFELPTIRRYKERQPYSRGAEIIWERGIAA